MGDFPRKTDGRWIFSTEAADVEATRCRREDEVSHHAGRAIDARKATTPPIDCATTSTGPSMAVKASRTRSSGLWTSDIAGTSPNPGQSKNRFSHADGKSRTSAAQKRPSPDPPGKKKTRRAAVTSDSSPRRAEVT